MRKQGKIISIPATEVTEGMQIVQGNRLWHNLKKDTKREDTYVLGDSINKPIKNIGLRITELKTLVVEYEKEITQSHNGEQNTDFYPPYNTHTTKQLPLKYSQWQSAIDNGEVDSDKVVEFEVVTKDNGVMSYTEGYSEIQYAEIIN